MDTIQDGNIEFIGGKRYRKSELNEGGEDNSNFEELLEKV